MPKRASFYIPCKPMALNSLSYFSSPFYSYTEARVPLIEFFLQHFRPFFFPLYRMHCLSIIAIKFASCCRLSLFLTLRTVLLPLFTFASVAVLLRSICFFFLSLYHHPQTLMVLCMCVILTFGFCRFTNGMHSVYCCWWRWRRRRRFHTK